MHYLTRIHFLWLIIEQICTLLLNTDALSIVATLSMDRLPVVNTEVLNTHCNYKLL